MAEEEVGIVDHWFGHIDVAGVKVTNGTIKVGDTLHFKGHTTDFQTTVESIQVEHETIDEAKVDDDIGLKVAEKVRKHDKVYKVIPD